MDIGAELLKMVVKDLHPMHLVEEAGFRAFLKALNPVHRVPYNTSSAHTELKKMYENKKIEVKKALDRAKRVVLTAELWHRSSENYLTLSCHYIDKTWARKSFVLETTRLMEGHDADSVVSSAANRWGICKKISVVVSNNKKEAVQKNVWHVIPCFAHILDTTFESAAKSVWGDQWNELLKKCSNIVDFISGNQEIAQKFKKRCQEKSDWVEYPLRWSMDDKWPVILNMLEWISKQSTSIQAVLDECKSKLGIKPVDKTKIIDALDTLRLFRNAVQGLGEDYHPISEIIPLLIRMHSKLTEDRSELRVEIAKKCERRIYEMKQNDWMTFSTILDPRFQIGFADQPENKKAAIVDEMKKLGTTGPGQGALVPKPDLRSVLERYLGQEPLPKEKNPLEFWKDQKNLTALAPLAQKYLMVVSTALPLERAFRPEIYKRQNMKRTCLEPETIDMMLFLQGNLTSG
ncbi:hypothetical protein ACEWY4_026367 [Coilia grayii]|uniref:HAT C-terminal dimerisation domain-containing protein n=1 Tax=Coilia grayii TaxID=363190 RepID=A0ABD1IUN3_9TELE